MQERMSERTGNVKHWKDELRFHIAIGTRMRVLLHKRVVFGGQGATFCS